MESGKDSIQKRNSLRIVFFIKNFVFIIEGLFLKSDIFNNHKNTLENMKLNDSVRGSS